MTEPIDYIYHCHTYRCGHASGTDEEFAEAAVEMGYKILGYTDHIILPDLSQKGMRGDPSLKDGYIKSVREIEQKYAGKLDVYLGFEAEWFGSRYQGYYESLLNNEIDYMILGQHCYLFGDEIVFYGRQIEDKGEQLQRYEKDLIEGMESGLFVYVCHPDVFMQWYPLWDDKCDKVARHICEKALELDMPLEVNMGCSYRKKFEGRRDYYYPHPRFWKVASEYGVKVILGLDTHHPFWIKQADVGWFLAFIRRNKLNLIDRIPIKKHL